MKVKTDYKKLAVLLLPTFLRQPVMVALARVLMHPLALLHDTYCTKRDDHLFDLAHNGQVCRLKDALNSLDDRLTYQEGFEIMDINALGDFVMAYDEAEYFISEQQMWVVNDEPNGTLVYDEAEITVDTESFVVFVPTKVHGEDIFSFNGSKPADPRIVATVEKFRLVSRTATYREKIII